MKKFLPKLPFNLKRPSKQTVRLITASTVVGSCTFAYTSEHPSAVIFRRSFHALRTLLAVCVEYKFFAEDLKACHRRCARRVYDLCQCNGGIYVKAAQLLCTANYSIPREYVEELIGLTDNARQSTFADIVRVVEEDLGRPLEEVFSAFERIPIGCASLAQVHRATIKDTAEDVVVKVQHPHLSYEIPCDYAVLRFIFKVIDSSFKGLNLSYLIEHTRKGITEELDFVHEAQNMQRARALYGVGSGALCRVPVLSGNLSTQRLLVMEYMRGLGIAEVFRSDAYTVQQKDLISKKVIQLFAAMIFRDGFVHCDPHPGNILIDPKTFEVQLLDHGLYRELSDTFQNLHAELWHNLFIRNDAQINRIAAQMDIPDFGNILSLLFTQRTLGNPSREKLTDVKHSFRKMGLIDKNHDLHLPTVSRVLSSVPEDFLFVLKTIMTVRSVTLSLGCKGMVRQRYYAFAANQAHVQHLRAAGRRWRAVCAYVVFQMWFLCFSMLYR